MRTMKASGGIKAASKQPLRDVDWAAATPHVLSTVGDDQRLRVWDLRCALSGSAVRRTLHHMSLRYGGGTPDTRAVPHKRWHLATSGVQTVSILV